MIIGNQFLNFKNSQGYDANFMAIEVYQGLMDNQITIQDNFFDNDDIDATYQLTNGIYLYKGNISITGNLI